MKFALIVAATVFILYGIVAATHIASDIQLILAAVCFGFAAVTIALAAILSRLEKLQERQPPGRAAARGWLRPLTQSANGVTGESAFRPGRRRS